MQKVIVCWLINFDLINDYMANCSTNNFYIHAQHITGSPSQQTKYYVMMVT